MRRPENSSFLQSLIHSLALYLYNNFGVPDSDLDARNIKINNIGPICKKIIVKRNITHIYTFTHTKVTHLLW